MDITFPWAQYFRKCKKSNVPYAIFKQDSVHANQFGNQILARIIESYLARSPNKGRAKTIIKSDNNKIKQEKL